MLYQPGDRLQHYTGAVYHVHEVFPTGNCMVGIGSLAAHGEISLMCLN